MTIDTQKLRDALQRIPRQKWSKYRATVSIPETEDFAGLALSISGLSKTYARALAGYIAAANPDTTASMLDHIDAQATEIERLNARCDARGEQIERLRIQNEGYDGTIAKRDLEIERLRQLSHRPVLGQIIEEIHRRADKEWAENEHDFTVTITADEYRALCAEDAARAALSGESND